MSGDNNEDDIAVSVYDEIDEAGFDVPMVDLLLDEATDGQIDLMGDVLIHLVKKEHADWAAELCRMLIHRTTADGSKPEPDYHVASSVLRYIVDMQQVEAARKVCSFILVLKENDQAASYFDCSELALLLGNMVHHKHAKQAADIIYSFYCDDSNEGRMYHGGIPYLLGSLVDLQHTEWAVELSKYLMLNDDDYGGSPVDFSVMGWCMAQMVMAGRADWAATICEGLRAERLPWFQLPHLLEAVAAWSDYSYVQAIGGLMEEAPGPSNMAQPAQPRMPFPHAAAPLPQQQWPMQAGAPPYAAPPMGYPAQSMTPQMLSYGVQQPAQFMAPSYGMTAPYGRQQQWQPQQQQQRQYAQQQQQPQQQHAQRGAGPLANGRLPAGLPHHIQRDDAYLRTQNEMQELQRRIQQAEMQQRGGSQAAPGVSSLNASMQGLNLQQQQHQQQERQQPQQQQQQQQGGRASASANGPPPASGQILQDAAVRAQPFVPRGVHAPPFVPRGDS